EIGGVVRVKDGALASFNGNVEAIDDRTGRLRVSVDIFGRRTIVELDETQVEAA
ncbi:transcription termination/antitermination protein NusG, partial [Methylobacterium sp. E-005]|nr:transcription termination/antitermination protein NusG [Methylobacterium sp. E-005]